MKSYEFGVEMRGFLQGLLGVEPRASEAPPSRVIEQEPADATLPSSFIDLSPPARLERGAPVISLERPVVAWGPRVDTSKLKQLFGHQRVERFHPTPGGIDNLALSSTDVFEVPGLGEITVEFQGYFQVARDNPTTDDWATSDVFVNMTDLRLHGESEQLGPMTVTLNPKVLSAGQVFASGGARAAAACRIATAATFSAPRMGVTAFNKEPILLMNNAIESVPPVEDPNGKAHLFRLPMFDVRDPNGRPFAYLKSLKYTVGNYITQDDAQGIRARVASVHK